MLGPYVGKIVLMGFRILAPIAKSLHHTEGELVLFHLVMDVRNKAYFIILIVRKTFMLLDAVYAALIAQVACLILG